jgi:DinB superfamily
LEPSPTARLPVARHDDRLADSALARRRLRRPVASHFGGEPIAYETYNYPGDAATALTRLDAVYAAWIAGMRGLGAEGLSRPCGPAEGPWGSEPMVALVLHINREALHHGAEIALLRDLYRWKS